MPWGANVVRCPPADGGEGTAWLLGKFCMIDLQEKRCEIIDG
jgi:hypothetical protein